MAKKNITIRGLRQTKVMRAASKSYKSKTGRKPSNKQIKYWGRGYLKTKKLELKVRIIEEPEEEYFYEAPMPLYEHTLVWDAGYLSGKPTKSGRMVFIRDSSQNIKGDMIQRAFKERSKEIGFVGGEPVLRYGVEPIY